MAGLTVRIRGGKRQPRYYYHKDRGAENIVRFLTEPPLSQEPEKRDPRSEVQKRIDELLLACRRTDELIASIVERWK